MMVFEGKCYKVEFYPSVLRHIQHLYEFSVRAGVEVLASLVGQYSADQTKAIVLDLMCISSCEYKRNAGLMSAELAWLWKETNGRKFFLGEWHTHPANPNMPSALDLETAKDTAWDVKANCPQFIMAISGSNGLGVHIVSRSFEEPIELTSERQEKRR